MDKATSAVALGAGSLPWWWPSIGQATEAAALVVQVLSAAWLLLQMIGYLRRMNRGVK